MSVSTKEFDLLTTVEQGGCSAKLSPLQLEEALQGLPVMTNENLLVDISTHDDAGVYKLTDEIALIQTTDFFPPICSDPYEFGQIAAANALSDVYAMGGEVKSALNLVLFPANSIPLPVLKEILHGGIDKVKESGGVILGGHTIEDFPPKYGLAVTGIVHPEKIITNAGAQPGDMLILSKPVGAGVLVAGKRLQVVHEEDYQLALENMKLLNMNGAQIMQDFKVRCATDVTGFGLLGHGLKMAKASKVTLEIEAEKVPYLNGAYDLVDEGCIPGAAFKNQEFIEKDTEFVDVDYSQKMLLLDAQTSGGLLMAVRPEVAAKVVTSLKEADYPQSEIIGKVLSHNDTFLRLV